MRGFFAFIAWLIMAAIVAALAIFAVQNTGTATVHFLGWTFSMFIWWIAIGAAILGFVLAFLLVAPGSVAARWRSRGLRLERMQLEQQVAALQAERDQLGESHERLRAEHRTVVAERDRLRAQQAAATVATPTPATPAAAQSAVTPRQPVQAAPAQKTVPVAENQPATGTVTQAQPQPSDGGTTAAVPEEQPTLGERARAVFRRPTPEQQAAEQTQDEYPEGPTAPTP